MQKFPVCVRVSNCSECLQKTSVQNIFYDFRTGKIQFSFIGSTCIYLYMMVYWGNKIVTGIPGNMRNVMMLVWP